MKKIWAQESTPSLTEDHHCVLLHIPFQHISVVAVLCYPASTLHYMGVCSAVLAEEFMVCRDKRQKDSRKWQKGKINLVVPSDLHGLLSASSNPTQSADALTWIHAVSLPLLPAIGFAMPPVLIPQHDFPYFWACWNEGNEGWKRRPHCAHLRPGETACHRLISVITLDMPLCASDGETAMVIAYPPTVYTVTDRFLISNQDSGQRRIRDKNPYLFVHKVIDIKNWWLVLGTRIAYYGHRAEVISCFCPNIPVLT